MTRLIKRISKQAGLDPGTLIHIGEERKAVPKITIIDYSETQFQEREVKKVEECFKFKETSTVTWINIDGIHDTNIIEKMGECYEFHPLILEDILNTSQRPKMEDFGNYMFIVLKMLSYEDKGSEVQTEQISLILGSNFVISFQEKEGDVFNNIRERIRNSKGRIRKLGADYLSYALIDAIVDNYFIIIEKMGDKIEDMEEALIIDPIPKTVQSIHDLKRDTIFLRKSVWPLREVISGIERAESSLIKKNSKVFFRSVYDHTIQVIDTIETFRDMISGMLDIYLSSVSNRMNEVMKVLTIIATIFIPITFIAGVYGMNFKYMPELNWPRGYFGALGLMGFTVILMLIYFKRKRWI